VVAAGAALVAVTVPVAVVTAPVVVGGGVVVAAGAAAYGGYQTGLAASQLGTGAEVNQFGVPTGRQLTPAELGEKAADVTVGGAMIGAGAAGALRGRWAAQAIAATEAEAAIAASAGPGATRTWGSWLLGRKAPGKPGPQGNRAPATSSEPAYGGEHPEPWTPQVGSSQSGGSPVSGPGTGAGAGSNAPNSGAKPTPKFQPPTNPPQLPPSTIPSGTRIFRGKPTEQFPSGYWKIEKFDGKGWQRLDPRTMKPGPHPDTHIPLPNGYTGPFDN